MSRKQVTLAQEESRKKLHERIETFENNTNSNTIEVHRVTPFKIPTFVSVGSTGNTSAGRNSLNRYLRATGFSGLEVEISKETKVFYSFFEKEPILSRSVMSLPVKVPGKDKLEYVEVPVLDESERARDSPIKLPTWVLPGFKTNGKETQMYPEINVPKSGLTYDLFPFPAEPECNDEKQTVTYTKTKNGLPLLKTELEKELAIGIVFVRFRKLNGKVRTMYGTSNTGFIPKKMHPKNSNQEGSRQAGEDQVKMFDIGIQQWRSCRYMCGMSIGTDDMVIDYTS